MSAGSRVRAAGWTLLAVLTAAYVGWGLAPDAALYRERLTPHVLVALAAVVKIAFLAAGALVAFSCRDRLEPGNPARPAWALLSAGLFCTLVGQLSLAPYQLASGQSPFPSVGDLYFLLSYPFFIASFLVFLRGYREAGFPIGSAPERAAILGSVGLLALLAAVYVLRPLAAGGAGLLDRILNVAYPVLDLVLLLPLALLLRMALRLGVSRVGAVWAELLAGFLFLCLGDMFFVAFSTLGEQHVEPWMHATFLLSYGLIAGGAHQQLELMRG